MDWRVSCCHVGNGEGRGAHVMFALGARGWRMERAEVWVVASRRLLKMNSLGCILTVEDYTSSGTVSSLSLTRGSTHLLKGFSICGRSCPSCWISICPSSQVFQYVWFVGKLVVLPNYGTTFRTRCRAWYLCCIVPNYHFHIKRAPQGSSTTDWWNNAL